MSPLQRYMFDSGYWRADYVTLRLLNPRGIEILGFTITVDWTKV